MDRILHLWSAPAWRTSVIVTVAISLAYWIFPPAFGPAGKPGSTPPPRPVAAAPQPAPAPVPPAPAAWQRVPDPPAQSTQTTTKSAEDRARENQERFVQTLRSLDTLKPPEKTKEQKFLEDQQRTRREYEARERQKAAGNPG